MQVFANQQVLVEIECLYLVIGAILHSRNV